MTPPPDTGPSPPPAPAGIRVLEPCVGPGPDAPIEPAVERALRLLPRRGLLTVLLNDPQRHTASGPVLAEIARRAGAGRLRVLFASGSHTTAAPEREAFQRSVCGRLALAAVAWHDSRREDLQPVGDGPGGTWRAHPWVAQGRGVLAVGSVEPHYFAGFTGAHKTATVGVASWADIEANHAGALSDRARPGALEGNPVAEGIFAMLSALERTAPAAAVNLVQVGRRILAAEGGTVRGTLDAAAETARGSFIRRIPAPADAVIADVTGPLGRSFYQADKGIKNCEWAVRDGGCLILRAPCPDGIGQGHFVRLLREGPTLAAAEAVVRRRGYRLGDHKAVRLRRLTDPAARGVRVWLVSEGLSDDQAALLPLRHAASVDAALDAAGVRPGEQAVYLVRDAGNLAVLAGPDPAGRD